MVEFEVPEIDYTRYSNRQLAAIPLIVLAVALLILGGWYFMTGYPVNPGLEFTGGTELRLDVEAADGMTAEEQIENAFSAEVDSIRQVPADGEYVVTFREGDATATELEAEAREAGFGIEEISDVSASFGADTQILALGGLVVAFVGMSVLVFAMFRTFVPSIAVVMSAFSDVMVPLALMNLFGIELSLGTVAALLMMIGYSVDSDILLNNSILRRTGDFYESTNRAMRTGVTMTLTSISAMVVMTITAWIFGIGLLTAIGIILVFGLLTDLMNTYLLNVSLLRWYKYEGVKR